MDIKELNINQTSQAAAGNNHPWEFVRARVVMDLLCKYLPADNTCPDVIDIGCGDTFFLCRFCASHPSARPVAVDTAFTDDIIASLTAQHSSLGIRFFNDISQVNLDGHKASVIFMMDVIEHIGDDVAFLKLLPAKDYVGNDTVFLITVPAWQKLYCSHDKWLGHYRRYNLKLLRRHVSDAGLQVCRDGYFFFSLLIPRLFQKFFELIHPADRQVTGIGEWKGGPFLSRVYSAALLADYYFSKILRSVGIRLPGLSAYVICRRSSVSQTNI